MVNIMVICSVDLEFGFGEILYKKIYKGVLI